ncbi:MAG: hypothetical protein HW416_202 [Chloroflexi bacterium]|nr:hypothetical protein [Chloroflexota bacterium]
MSEAAPATGEPAVVPARPAATVVLVRPTGNGWETYLVRRSPKSPVLPSLWVFPGGTVRADDMGAVAETLDPHFSAAQAHAALARPPGSPAETAAESRGYFVTAARELFEEAGVLLASVAPGTSSISAELGPDAQWAQRRREVESGQPLAKALRDMGARLDLNQLAYYAHWMTPLAVPQRFDTRFFIARLPEGACASPSTHEMMEGVWIGALAALDRCKCGDMPLHFATLNHLRRLASQESIEGLFVFATTKAVVPVMPETRETEGHPVPYLPSELAGVW